MVESQGYCKTPFTAIVTKVNGYVPTDVLMIPILCGDPTAIFVLVWFIIGQSKYLVII